MTVAINDVSAAQWPSCRVVCGANESRFHNFVGQTVATVKKRLREVFNVAADALALVNGAVVDHDHLLCAGDTLEFLQPNGAKGLGNLFTAKDLIERWRINEAKYRELVERGLPALKFADGSTVHPEIAVDEWLRRIAVVESDTSIIAAELRRIANYFDPPPPDKVGSEYVAQKLGCTTTWIADLVRRAEIPKSCIVPGTGNGKAWKFFRERIDKWIENR